jgi:hypothetical protein
MDFEEYKQDFLETVNAKGSANGEGKTTAFVNEVADSLINMDILPDFTPSYCVGVGKQNRKYRVDGYVYDGLDQTMNLIIADYDNLEERVIARTGINQLVGRVSYFVDLAFNSNLYREIEPSIPGADLIDFLRENKDLIRKYRILIFTNAKLGQTVKQIDIDKIENIVSECQIWDLERIYNIVCSKSGRENIEIDFKELANIELPCIETGYSQELGYKSYLCVIPGTVLADIYDKYGSLLLEGNVRSFLSTKVEVNKKIQATILNRPKMFFAFNNGIAVTSKSVEIISDAHGQFVKSVKDFQIINGGQTTASLSNTRRKYNKDLSDIYVQMKLTEIGEMSDEAATELIRDISRSSNSQNKVNDADFFATHPFHVRMEQISRTKHAPAVGGVQYGTIWFYERARGQFLQAQMRLTKAQKRAFLMENPKKQVITKTDLAKYRNTWDELPQVVSKGAQTNFMAFAKIINEAWEKDDSSFNDKYFKETVALAVMFKELELIIPTLPWYQQGYRANIIYYSMALFHRLISKKFKDKVLNLMLIWNKQTLPTEITNIYKEIAKLVFEKITDPNRPTINVTQWCKRDACWDSIKDMEIKLPADIKPYLIDKTEDKALNIDSVETQKVKSDIDVQNEVLSFTANQWLNLMQFAQSKHFLTPDEQVAIRIAVKIPTRIPNAYQSRKLLALIERMKTEGFLMK